MSGDPHLGFPQYAARSRRGVDLRALRPAWLRHLLVLMLVIPIVLLAWLSFRANPIPETSFAPYVPLVGWLVVAVLSLAIGLRLYGAWQAHGPVGIQRRDGRP